jgi:hypothetical protein
MQVNTDSSFLTKDMIKKIEKARNCKYVFESCLKTVDGGWFNGPAAIFYNEEKHPTGSNYMAVYVDGRTLYLADGISAVDNVIYEGIEAEGEVVYSRYRHDFREHKNGAYIDGGRDYTKVGGDKFNDYNLVQFKVVGGKIVFIAKDEKCAGGNWRSQCDDWKCVGGCRNEKEK